MNSFQRFSLHAATVLDGAIAFLGTILGGLTWLGVSPIANQLIRGANWVVLILMCIVLLVRLINGSLFTLPSDGRWHATAVTLNLVADLALIALIFWNPFPLHGRGGFVWEYGLVVGRHLLYVVVFLLLPYGDTHSGATNHEDVPAMRRRGH